MPVPGYPCPMPSQGKREDGSWVPGFVAIIEMIGSGVVKIDCLFHQPQSQNLV
jgi:hypothetical protein